MSAGLIIGLVVGGLCFVIVLVFVLYFALKTPVQPKPKPKAIETKVKVETTNENVEVDKNNDSQEWRKHYKLLRGRSLVNGKVSSGKDSSDGTIKYLGTYNNIDQCVNEYPTFRSYTWIHNDPSKGAYKTQCFGTNNKTVHRFVDTKTTSAVRRLN